MEQPQQSCHGVTALTLLAPEERMDPSGTRATPQGHEQPLRDRTGRCLEGERIRPHGPGQQLQQPAGIKVNASQDGFLF